VAVICVLLAGLLAALASGPQVALAANNSTEAPTLQGGERVNVTQMSVTVADDDDVDESTISADDFALSDGSIASVNSSESGSNATVTISLAERLDVDTVTVSIASDGNITDTSGNAMTNGSVNVTGMDSYYPAVRSFRVSRNNGTSGTIRIESSEELADFRVEITGPREDVLTRTNFTHVNPRGFDPVYKHTREFDADGEYRITLDWGTDEGGNSVNFSRATTFTRDPSDPVAAIDAPRHVDQGDRTVFDGGPSTDNIGIASYNWSIEGNTSGSGETFEHAFPEPGSYEVTLTVRDTRGNHDNTTQTVTVHDAPSTDGVAVAGNRSTSVTATVSSGREEDAVRITDAYGRLAVTEEVTLSELRPSLAADQGATIDISTGAVPSDFGGATNATGVGSFTVSPNRSLGETTVRFAVPPSRLAEAGLSFADVTLYHKDGDWEPLETEVVRATERAVVYEATAPGFSTLVVGGSPSLTPKQQPTESGGSADISVVSAELLTSEVRFGEPALVSASLQNKGQVSGTSTVGVTAGTDVVATRPVTIPANETRTVELSFAASENATVAVNGSVAGDLVVTDVPTPADSGTEAGEGANSSGGGFIPSISIPNPLALWPDGIVGTALAGLIGFVVVAFLVLKTVAWYLGY
jgi:hypothetical protein